MGLDCCASRPAHVPGIVANRMRTIVTTTCRPRRPAAPRARRAWLSLLAALPLLLAACDGASSLLQGGGGSLTLVTLGTVVAPGASLEVVANNETLQGFGHGVCSIGIERREADRWVGVWPPAGSACIAVGRTLASGGSYRQVVPAPSAEGTYRATMRLQPSGASSDVTVASAPFEVTATTAVELTATADSVDDGASLPLLLRNLSGTVWGFNTCANGRFQRLLQSQWFPAPEPLALCTADIQTLGGLQERTAAAAVPIGYAAGTYRFVLRLDAAGSTLVAASDTFVVR